MTMCEDGGELKHYKIKRVGTGFIDIYDPFTGKWYVYDNSEDAYRLRLTYNVLDKLLGNKREIIV